MKKIFSLSLSLVAALMLAMWSSQASAIDLAHYNVGQLVPVALQGPGVDTLVGLTFTTTATTPGLIHWSYFDKNSNHQYDGVLPATNNDYVPFSWHQIAGSNFVGQ